MQFSSKKYLWKVKVQSNIYMKMQRIGITINTTKLNNLEWFTPTYNFRGIKLSYYDTEIKALAN